MSCAKQCWAPSSSPFHFLLSFIDNMLPLSWIANYLRDAKLSGLQLEQEQAQSNNSSRFNRLANLCRFNIIPYHHIIRPCSILLLGFSMLPFRLLFMLYFPIHSQYFVLQATYRQNQNSSQSQQWINSEEKENCSQQQVFSTPRVNLGVCDTWGYWAP